MVDPLFSCFCYDTEIKFLTNVYKAFESEFALAFILQASIIMTATMYSQFYISLLLLCGKAGVGLSVAFAALIHLVSNIFYVYLNGRNDFNGYSARVISDILSRSCAFMWVSVINSVFTTPYYGNSTDSGAIMYSRTGAAVTLSLFVALIFITSMLETYVYIHFNLVANVVGKVLRVNPAILHSIKKNFSPLMPLFSPIVFCIPVGYSLLALVYSLLWKNEPVATTQRSYMEQVSLLVYAVIVTVIAANSTGNAIGKQSYMNLASNVLDSASAPKEWGGVDDSAMVNRITISDFHRGESTSPEYSNSNSNSGSRSPPPFRNNTFESKNNHNALSASLLDEGSIENDFIDDKLFGKATEQNQPLLATFGIKARFYSALQQVVTEVQYAIVAFGWLYTTQFTVTINFNDQSAAYNGVKDVVLVFINAFIIFWFTRRVATQYIMTVRVACGITHKYEDIGYINYCIIMERVMVFIAGVQVSGVFTSVIMADISGYTFTDWLKLLLTLFVSIIGTVFVLRSEKSFLSSQLILKEKTTEIVEELFDKIREKYGFENSAMNSNTTSLNSETPFSTSTSIISSEVPTVVKSQPTVGSPFHHSTNSSNTSNNVNSNNNNHNNNNNNNMKRTHNYNLEPLSIKDFYGRWVRQGVFAVWHDPLLLLQSVCCPCYVIAEAEYVSLDSCRDASPGACGTSRLAQVRAVFILACAMALCAVASIVTRVHVYTLLPVSLGVLLIMVFRVRVNTRRRFAIPGTLGNDLFLTATYSPLVLAQAKSQLYHSRELEKKHVLVEP